MLAWWASALMEGGATHGSWTLLESDKLALNRLQNGSYEGPIPPIYFLLKNAPPTVRGDAEI